MATAVEQTMAGTSKTGLLSAVTIPLPSGYLPSAPHKPPRDLSPMAGPAPVVLRPFAGIHNPFPYGCSVLCNHPADLEARDSLRRACKDAWLSDGRVPEDVAAAIALRAGRGGSFPRGARASFMTAPVPTDDWVPEELFRKYTETDSRPATPAPTLASVNTKGTSLAVRRCLTPDPATRERTLLVLDLRRSHSQEALSWRGMVTPVPLLPPPSSPQPRWKRYTASPERAMSRRHLQGFNRPCRTNLGRQSPARRSRSIRRHDKSESPRSSGPPASSVSAPELLTGEEEEDQEMEAPQTLSPRRLQQLQQQQQQQAVSRRRGKHRRAKKLQSGRSGSPEKEFKTLDEPGETQISTLGERGSSARPRDDGKSDPTNTSTTAEGAKPVQAQESEEQKEYRSFLQRDILTRLQRQLVWEDVEGECDLKRRTVLAEALRAPRVPSDEGSTELQALMDELRDVAAARPELWAAVPRAFSRRSARFELPLDSRQLNVLTPVEYLRTHVRVTPARRLLYTNIFNRHREDTGLENEARLIELQCIPDALADILGQALTQEELSRFGALLDVSSWEEGEALDLRAFCGVAAACERLLGAARGLLAATQEDPRAHIETADFESLSGRLARLKDSSNPLCNLLRAIREA